MFAGCAARPGAGRAPLLLPAGWGGRAPGGSRRALRDPAPQPRARPARRAAPLPPASRIPGEGAQGSGRRAVDLAEMKFSELLIQIDFLFGFPQEFGPNERVIPHLR